MKSSKIIILVVSSSLFLQRLRVNNLTLSNMYTIGTRGLISLEQCAKNNQLTKNFE